MIIEANQMVELIETQILDWHDRPIAEIGIIGENEYVLSALIAWNRTEKFGIRLYFPISSNLASSLRNCDWDLLKSKVETFVQEFTGKFACTVENEPCRPTQVNWLEAVVLTKLQANVMDVDATMNNSDIDKWVAIANA